MLTYLVLCSIIYSTYINSNSILLLIIFFKTLSKPLHYTIVIVWPVLVTLLYLICVSDPHYGHSNDRWRDNICEQKTFSDFSTNQIVFTSRSTKLWLCCLHSGANSSNLCTDTCFPDWRYPWFSSVLTDYVTSLLGHSLSRPFQLSNYSLENMRGHRLLDYIRGGWLTPRPSRFTPPPLPPRYPLYKRLDGPHGQSTRVRKVSSAPGFNHLLRYHGPNETVQIST
jgi:hypothetical protein